MTEVKFEIEELELQDRSGKFWANGNAVALQYGREDLVLSEEERVAQSTVAILEDRFLEAGRNVVDWAEIGDLEHISDHIKFMKDDRRYKSGSYKMGRLVEEVLK